jgi:hypothetical protein
MPNKHGIKPSALLVIRKMHSKTAKKYHFIIPGMVKIKKLSNIGEDGESLALWQNDLTTM